MKKRVVEIFPNETAPHLRTRLSHLGGEELISCLQRLPQFLENACPQPEDGVTYGKRCFLLFSLASVVIENTQAV